MHLKRLILMAFISVNDNFLPQWRTHREELNRAPLSHADWDY
jgi:hypothetical protein